MSEILIVDDHENMTAVLAALVRHSGHTPIVMNNGAAALAYIADHSVDLVILDNQMPCMTGLDVLRSLQAGPKTSPPIIMFSASNLCRKDALALGAVKFLLKTQIHELIESIAEYGAARGAAQTVPITRAA